MTTAAYFAITDGPSREALLDAFKYAYSQEHPFRVRFTGFPVRQTGDVRPGPGQTTYTVKVTGLKHEDGSGQKFVINALIPGGGVAQIFYDTQRCTGHLEMA